MTDTFSLTLLGLPVVRQRRADGREAELRWRLRRSLLSVAFLALQPDRRARRDALVEAVWPDVSRETVAKNFHPTLSDARRTLGGPARIVFRQGIYALDPDADWDVDVERFEASVRRGGELAGAGDDDGALAAWSEAWGLYRGPFLVEHDEAWIARRREALRESYLHLLADVGRLAARHGRDTQAIDAYRTLLLEEPYEERVHLALMELYARQGRRDLVRRQYVRLQEWLEELDVEPLEETQRAYHELMR